MIQNNYDLHRSEEIDPEPSSEDLDQDLQYPAFPAEAAETVGPEDVDVHGKLGHLNALDLSSLTLHKRCVMINLAHPPFSDELGRFMTTAGAYPSVPALSAKETQVAIDSLIEDKLIATWNHGGSTCWEVAGAYAFKPALKWHLAQRGVMNKKKKEEAAKRCQRKKDLEEGVEFVREDDNKGVADDGVVHEKIRTKRGNLVPNRPEFYFNSKVPQRKGRPQHEMLVNQPATPKGCILKLLPSFYPAEDLSPLAAVIRFYLLMDCDDFGRVRVEVKKLHSQLGPAITKRVSKEQIEQELSRMERTGHLIRFRRKQGVFGYLRDSAQHLKEVKRYDRQIPPLFADREFTYDSDQYKAFFEACREHSSKRDKVRVAQFNERGDVTIVWELAKVAAERFAQWYEEIISKEPFSNLTPEQVCGFEDCNEFIPDRGSDFRFFHGFKSGLSGELMELLYLQESDYFDGEVDDPKDHKILTHLIGMTPREYVELLKSREENHAKPADEKNQFLVVPGDPDEMAPPPPPSDDEPPPVVPWDEDIPPIVP
jgi:hypothetical protein